MIFTFFPSRILIFNSSKVVSAVLDWSTNWIKLSSILFFLLGILIRYYARLVNSGRSTENKCNHSKWIWFQLEANLVEAYLSGAIKMSNWQVKGKILLNVKSLKVFYIIYIYTLYMLLYIYYICIYNVLHIYVYIHKHTHSEYFTLIIRMSIWPYMTFCIKWQVLPFWVLCCFF